MRTRKIFLLPTVLLILFLFSACSSQNVPTYDAGGSRTVQVTLRIVTMDSEKFFDGQVKVKADTPTAYMALKAGADNKKLALNIQDETAPDKMFLQGIADLNGENPNFWMFYINGLPASAGMGTQEIKENDVVTFIYGDYNKGFVNIA